MNEELTLSSVPVSSAELLAEDPIDEQVLVAAVNTKLNLPHYKQILKDNGKITFNCDKVYSSYHTKILSKYFNQYNGWQLANFNTNCVHHCEKGDTLIREHITFTIVPIKKRPWWNKLWK